MSCNSARLCASRLPEADPGIGTEALARDAAGHRRLDPFGEEVAHLGHDVVVGGIVLHRLRLALHVHQDQPGARLPHRLEHSGRPTRP